MKHLIFLIIRIYWHLKPKNRPPRCLFRHNCSNYIYDQTKQNGWIAGLQAFWFRVNNCRPGYFIFKDPETGKTLMQLRTGKIISEEEIAERLLIK